MMQHHISSLRILFLLYNISHQKLWKKYVHCYRAERQGRALNQKMDRRTKGNSGSGIPLAQATVNNTMFGVWTVWQVVERQMMYKWGDRVSSIFTSHKLLIDVTHQTDTYICYLIRVTWSLFKPMHTFR